MHFLYPVFLSALLVLLIPIAIHLFHFRRYKTVQFSNVKFLRQVESERRNQNRLRHLLVLCSRCLALICLVLAFAIPGCGTKAKSTGKKAVSIYIDNSFSMEQKNASGILFETARQKAREIVKSLGDQAEFVVFANDPVSNQSFSGATEALRRIDELQVSSQSPSAGKIWKQMQDQLASATNADKSGYLISDFQKGFVRELPASKSAGSFPVYGLKLDAPEKGNISIDTAWLDNPFGMAGEKVRVLFRVSNFTAEKAEEINVRLMVNGSVSGLAKLSPEAWGSANASIEFSLPSNPLSKAWLELDDPDNTFDNKLYFSLQPQGNMDVAFQGGNRFAKEALSTNRFFNLIASPQPGTSVWYISDCQSLDATTASQVNSFVAAGGRAVLVPAANAPLNVFAALENIAGFPAFRSEKSGAFRLDRNGLGHVFFNQVFSSVPRNIEMPQVRRYFSTEGALGNGDAVLGLENGDPFLIRFHIGKGYLYLFTSAFGAEQGNFVQSSLFLPVIVNCAFNYEQIGSVYGVTASNRGYLLRSSVPQGDVALKLSGDKAEFVPEVQQGAGAQELYIGSHLGEAGFFTLHDASGKVNELIALNYPRSESDPRTAGEEQLQKLQSGLGIQWMRPGNARALTQQLAADSQLWRLFIWLAAAFFAVEVILLVLWDPVTSLLRRKTRPVQV